MKHILIATAVLIGSFNVSASGRYIGDQWVPEGVCYHRAEVEEGLRAVRADKLARLDQLLANARGKNVDWGRVNEAAAEQRRTIEMDYRYFLNAYAPVFCQE